MELNKKILNWISKGLCLAGLAAIIVGSILVIDSIVNALYAVSGRYFIFGIGAILTLLGFTLRALINCSGIKAKSGTSYPLLAAAIAAAALCLPLSVAAFITDTYIWLNLCTVIFLIGIIGYSAIGSLRFVSSGRMLAAILPAVLTAALTIVFAVNYSNFSQHFALLLCIFAAACAAVSVAVSH